MPDGWRECALGDVVDLKRGYDLPEAQRRPGRVPIISSSGPSGWHDEPKVKAPGVVTGRYGTIGEVFYVEQDFWPLNTSLYVRDFKGNDERFISYFLRALDFQSFNDKSSVPGLNRNDLHRYEVTVPLPTEQRAIAGVLGALDDKIEQNRRTSAALERLARAMFRACFVDFEPVKAKAAGATSFPSMPQPVFDSLPTRFVDSELGPVPEGWEVKPIGEVVSVKGGATPSTANPDFWEGGTHCWATPKDMSRLSDPVLLDTERRITDAGVEGISSGLLPVGTVLLSSRAPVGYLAITAVPTAVNQGFIAMVCDGPLPAVYVLNWAETSMDTIKGRASGTTFPEISKKNFRPIPVVVPPPAVAKAYREIVEPLFELLVAMLKESEKLAQLRDYLLPKLLCGQVRVREIRAEPAAVIGRIDPEPKATTQRKATDEFKEAVLIAALVRALASPQYPLGRKRYNKFAYFVHRKAEHDVRDQFLKKAAGPYSPWARYQGPEKIAKGNGYVKACQVERRTGLLAGDKIAMIDHYLPRYGFQDALEWAVARFRFKKNDDLELLATVDFAALDLIERGQPVNVRTIHDLIASEPEWVPKLDRAIFSDSNIEMAINELRQLFPDGHGQT